MRIEKVIGRHIAEARKERKLTQMTLAIHMTNLLDAEWSPTAVSKAENGQRKFTAEELYAISVLLQKPIEFFFALPADERTVEFSGEVTWTLESEHPLRGHLRMPLDRRGAESFGRLGWPEELQEEGEE